MKKIMDKLDSALINVQFRARNFISNQRGDTNFISIAIILIVVLVIAVVFINFAKLFAPELTKKTTEVLNALEMGQ